MTSLLERPAVGRTGSSAPTGEIRPSRRGRLLSLAVVVPMMALAGVLARLNFGGSPQRIDDEGTYTAQAYAIEAFGQLAHYTYWYDHPPLGWMQITAWTWATQGFERYGFAVIAGREAMVVFHVVAVGLLWLLARRLGMGRLASGATVLIYAVSPLAVQFSRTVFLDNVAVPWLLAAWVLALSRRHQLPAFAGAALCFGVAALSKETFLLLLPFLMWTMWRSAHADTRRYTLSVAGSLLTLLLASYAVYALIKGEVLPGEGRVSLWEGIAFQLFEREGSGSVLDAGTQAGRSVQVWLTLDPVLATAGIVAAVGALWSPRLRPVAAALLFHLLVLLKPGYLPVPFVIVMIPLAALLVPAVLEALVRRGRPRRARSWTVVGLAGAVAFAAVAAPVWFVQLRGLMLSDADQPMRQAQSWIRDNVDRDDRLLVDDAVWVDLVRAGFDRQNVVWYYKADTDPAVYQRLTDGWTEYDYVLLTQAIRRSVESAPTVQRALESSTEVASFGTGESRVQVFQVQLQGAGAVEEAAKRDLPARAAAGQSLVDRADLQLTGTARDALTGGQVDSRLVSLLAVLAGREPFGVSAFPVVPGEAGLAPARTVVIDEVDGEPVTPTSAEQLVSTVRDQRAPFRAETVTTSQGRLVIQFAPAPPSDVLPTP